MSQCSHGHLISNTHTPVFSCHMQVYTPVVILKDKGLYLFNSCCSIFKHLKFLFWWSSFHGTLSVWLEWKLITWAVSRCFRWAKSCVLWQRRGSICHWTPFAETSIVWRTNKLWYSQKVQIETHWTSCCTICPTGIGLEIEKHTFILSLTKWSGWQCVESLLTHLSKSTEVGLTCQSQSFYAHTYTKTL